MRCVRLLRCPARTRPRGRRLPPMTCATRPSGSRRSSAARRRLEVGEPDLDERAHRVFEARLAGDRERLFPALARLLGVDALLQPVVSRDEQLLNPLPGILTLHESSVTTHGVRYPASQMISLLAVVQVLLVFVLVGLVLMHSGRDAGMGGMGFTPASQGGTHIVERNLTRFTVVIGVLFFANSIALFHYLK